MFEVLRKESFNLEKNQENIDVYVEILPFLQGNS